MLWMALCWSEKPDKQGDRRHRLARLHPFKNNDMCHRCLFLLCLWLILDNDQSRSRYILGGWLKLWTRLVFGYWVLVWVPITRKYSFIIIVLGKYSASTRQVLDWYSDDTDSSWVFHISNCVRLIPKSPKTMVFFCQEEKKKSRALAVCCPYPSAAICRAGSA